MLWILFLFIIIGGLLYSAWKFGLFEKFEMQNGKLMACEILYLPYKGDYTKIGPLFEEVSRTTKTVFAFSQNFGFYFDDPSITVPQNCRAIVGILVNEGEEFKIRQFLSQHKEYRRAHLNTTRYMSYEMPFVNVFSILLMIKTIYPKIQDYLKKEDINVTQICGMMELYKCIRSDKKIQIILPLHNKEQFLDLLQNADQYRKTNEQLKKNYTQEYQNHDLMREE